MYMIQLTRDQTAIVDRDDYELLANYKWHVTKNGYAARRLRASEGGKIVLMHRVIMGAVGTMQVDHRNHNKLDNRRSNLRLATSQENRRNQRTRSDNKTGYKGVCWVKQASRFVAQIKHEQGNIIIGYYETAIEAARAYNNAAADLFGEFAYLNEV